MTNTQEHNQPGWQVQEFEGYDYLEDNPLPDWGEVVDYLLTLAPEPEPEPDPPEPPEDWEVEIDE